MNVMQIKPSDTDFVARHKPLSLDNFKKLYTYRNGDRITEIRRLKEHCTMIHELYKQHTLRPRS